MVKRRRFKLTDPQRFTAWLAGAVGVFLTCMAAGSGFIQLLLVAVLLLAGTGVVVLMLRRTGGRTVVRRTAQVLRASGARPGAVVGPCTIELRIRNPGEAPHIVTVQENRVPLIKWPRPGMQLPVDVSRRNPNNLRVRWDLVLPSSAQRPAQPAAATATAASQPAADPFRPAEAGAGGGRTPPRGGAPFQGSDRLPSAESSPGSGGDLDDLYAEMDPDFIAEMKRLESLAELGALDESYDASYDGSFDASYDPDGPTMAYDPDAAPKAITGPPTPDPDVDIDLEEINLDDLNLDDLNLDDLNLDELHLEDLDRTGPDPDDEAPAARTGPIWPNIPDHPAGPERLTDLDDEPDAPEPRNPFPVTPPSQRTDPGVVEPFVVTGSSRREPAPTPPPTTPPPTMPPTTPPPPAASQVEAEPDLTLGIPAPRAQADDDEVETVRLADDTVEGVADLAAGGVGVMLVVADLARSLRFYRETLGFRLVGSAPGSAVLSYGGGRIMLRRVLDMSPVQRRLAHVQIAVSNVDDAYQRLRAKGVEFMHRPQASRVDGLEVRTATLRDPDGHAIALTEWRTLPS
jgi:catechol 2,3-dioxygenase-like lactoylglutathione lyase family enzyme